MKILHVLSNLDPSSGGVMTVVEGLARAQQALGVSVTVVSNMTGRADEQAVVKKLQDAGIEVAAMPRGYRPTRWAPGMGKQMRSLASGVDLVHIHGIWEEIQHQAAKQCRALGKPYYIAPHGMLDPWSLNQSALRKKIYLALRLREDLNRAAALHFTAAKEAELVKPLQLKPKVIVEANGLDVSDFAKLPGRAGLESWMPEAQDKKVILFFGRLHPKKGLDLLLPAFAQLERDDALLVVAGPCDQAYREKLDAACHELGIAERVMFTGMLGGERRLGALSGADLFVLPSYQENFGMAIIEALICGTAVVISDQINIHDAITEAGVGEVVTTEQAPLVDALQRWLDHDAMRLDAASRGPAFVTERYDWRALAERWLGHYEATVGAA